MSKASSFAIVWADAPRQGQVEVHHGRWTGGKITQGRGGVKGETFRFTGGGPARLVGRIANAAVEPGPHATRVRIDGGDGGFTFFLRDVNPRTPILLPHWGVAITSERDQRDYAAIDAAVRVKGLASELQRIEAEPEENYENACAATRDQVVPLWLGLSRDMRIFSLHYGIEMGYLGKIQPLYHCTQPKIAETKDAPYAFWYAIGRGAGCRVDLTRRLDDGFLPILRATQRDGDVDYNLTGFVTLETRPLDPKRLRGSDWLALYANSAGHMLTQAEKDRYEKIKQPELYEREEETVCCLRFEAVNTAAVPRYAFFKGIGITAPAEVRYDAKRGMCQFSSGRVFAIQRLDGKPLPAEETAVLLQPGAKVVVDFIIPHQPLPPQRAAKLAKINLQEHLEACREYWRAKLDSAAQVQVPEPAVDERIKAGLIHLDMISYGREPKGAVATCVGVYSPIGSESSPIIQFFDSMGWHDLAARSLQFFFDRQRDDGFIQTFGGYQLETGPVLWSAGEHYRYTRDDRWARSVRPNILKACEYVLNWRNRNKRKELRGKGYGLLDGKVADPEDFFHSFMLNGLAYAGIQRAGEMLARIDPANARRLAREAQAYRADIRADYEQAVARSPVIPTGDGAWIPSAPPWSEYPGPLALFAEGGNWFTHGAIGARDSLIGSTYLVLGEVFDAGETIADFMLKQHQELNTLRNAAFSQPYYSRHDFLHARRGEVKPFLKTYYNQFAALQDRQSYSFWEHYFHASAHKTHEEGWFLMQTRWMLYHEDGSTLRVLPLIPRRWLEDGKEIRVRDMVSYFGPVSVEVQSQVARGRIRASVTCDTARPPREVVLRLPHPLGLKASAVKGGRYDPASESVLIAPFRGKASVELSF